VEQIRIPVKRQWFILLFVPFWLLFWTFGGIAAASDFVRTGEPFLAFWLCGWVAGELFAIVLLGDQIAGSETIRTIGRDLEISGGFGPVRRTRLYRGDQIANLRPGDPSSPFAMFRMPLPSFMKVGWGAVKFDYGAETIYFGSNAHEAEGRLIVDWLRPRLPASAVAA
jgi:hypothetical protein